MEKGLASAFVIRWPFWPSGRDANEIERARISMMARGSKAPSIGRIQMRKTNLLQTLIFGLQRAAGPYRRARNGRRISNMPDARCERKREAGSCRALVAVIAGHAASRERQRRHPHPNPDSQQRACRP